MDTEQLKVFLQIVDSGSIQGAARTLGATRSSLRRTLEELETEAGVPLLHRDPEGVRVTAAGAVLLEGGGSLLDASRALIADVRAASGEATGILRILEPVGIPMAFHVKLMLALRLALPNQRLVIRHVENPLAHLHERFELMIHEGDPPDRSTWFSRIVLRTPLRLAASRAYVERRGAPRDVAELAQHEILGWQRPGLPADTWPLLAGGTVTVAPWISSTDPHLLGSLLAEGGGIMLAPRTPLFTAPGAEPLVTLLEDQVGADVPLRVSTPFSIRSDSRARDTLRVILEQLKV
jgi:DNA-binding transcriptional LysR family regulator